MGIYGLAYGTVLGAVLFLATQIPGLIRYQFRWVPKINLQHPGVQQVLRVIGPRIGSVFFIYLVLIYIPDNIASRLPTGSITALVYGWLIMQVPETLIGTTIGTALLPTISKQITRHEMGVFTQSLNRALRVILSLALPVSLLLAMVIRPLVDVFGFDPVGTEMVIWTARAFLIGLAGHSLLEIAARAYYAQQNAITPLWASALMMVTFSVLAILFSRLVGVAGIALANALAFTGEALLLLYLLNRKIPGLLRLGNTLVRVALGCVAAALLVYIILSMSLPLPSLILAVVALAIGGLAVLPFIWPELKLLVKL
jgi:putative peptidoglycan lipid II flippase